MNNAKSAPTRPSDLPASAKGKRRGLHRATKPQLLTRASLDKRTNAAKLFDRLAFQIQSDMGGRDQLSTVQLALIEAFCGSCVTLDNLNTRLLLGQEISLQEHAACVSAMVRVASRIGITRKMRDVGPSLSDIIRAGHERDRQRAKEAS